MEPRDRRQSRTTRRVQLQFIDGGQHATTVQEWLDTRFPHLHAYATANPGLCIELTLPLEHFDAVEGPAGRLAEATASLDLALEILDACLTEIDADPGEVLAVHLTRSL